MVISDKTLICVECSSPFTFIVGEEMFFASKPRRCPQCRGLGGSPREMYPAVCTECGKTAILPFRLRSDKQVYCSDCFFNGVRSGSELKNVYDPEIPVNVADLGLIYDVQVHDNNYAHVQTTLTAPGCALGAHIAQQAEWAILEVDGVGDVEVSMVFDPPWSPGMMSEVARSQLGF